MFISTYILFIIMILVFPLYINSIRCYKCDGTDACKTITDKSTLFNNNNNNKYEIVNCQHYCWKSVSFGNVYRGCGKKRCTVSHSVGSFSTSVCCQTDFCNQSKKLSISKTILTLMIIFICTYIYG